MILSQEQLEIVFCDSNMIINANAGSGKTTTLIEYARERPDKEILYLVFNKDLRKNVRKKFTLNTTVHTINSFIFFHLKDIFKNRKIVDNYNVNFFLKFINKGSEEKESDSIALYNKFNKYLVSEIPNKEMDVIFNEIILNVKYEITHDILKKYFLNNFNNFNIKFDIVLIDEAQDIDVIMFNIINKIEAKKIYMGDKKQAIYGFRNTINIFNENYIGYTKKVLSKSFRFNNHLASYINLLTTIAYGEEFNIEGEGILNSKILEENECFNEPYVFISRTNALLFKKAFEAVEKGLKVSIPFNFEELKYMVVDVYNLKANNINQIINLEIKNIGSYEKLKRLIKNGINQELNYIVKIIDEYDIMTLSYLKKLEINLVSPKYSDITFITAHKAKGLEFMNVEVGDDFKGYKLDINIEERNMFYVALTRATSKLKISKKYI